MKLHDEIQLIVARIDEDHINHEDETILIINKILDAAVEAVNEQNMDYFEQATAVTAINKLRSES